MTKPIVRYFKHLGVITPGFSAVIWPLDHPSKEVSNETWCKTSPVLTVNHITGEFETRNTKYIPAIVEQAS